MYFKKSWFQIQPEQFLNLFLIFREKFSLVSYKLFFYKKKKKCSIEHVIDFDMCMWIGLFEKMWERKWGNFHHDLKCEKKIEETFIMMWKSCSSMLAEESTISWRSNFADLLHDSFPANSHSPPWSAFILDRGGRNTRFMCHLNIS